MTLSYIAIHFPPGTGLPLPSRGHRRTGARLFRLVSDM
jgi:hypothetical protein